MRPVSSGTLLFCAVILLFGVGTPSRADVVTDWNDFATRIGPVAQPNPLLQSRVYAMTQVSYRLVLSAVERGDCAGLCRPQV